MPIIDVHFHMLATNDVPGCNLSRRTRFESAAGWIAGLVLGTLDEELMELIAPNGKVQVSSDQMRRRLLRELDGAREISGAVLLALDAIYDDGGNALATDVCVSEDFVVETIARHRENTNKRLFLGTSIHPNRRDACERLERSKREHGAVLVKWIPSSQRIDPSNPRYDSYYEKLRDLDLALLCHAGPESAVPNRPSDEQLNDPRRLKRALELGVTVIVAHGAAHFLPKPVRPEMEHAPHLASMLEQSERKGWKLYADISACLITPYRAATVGELINRFPEERFVYGSDFPIFTHDVSMGRFGRPIDGKWAVEAARVRNLLDKDVLGKRSVGVPQSIFENTARVLGIR